MARKGDIGMSVSHCMHKALDIAKRPRAEWSGMIDKLPTNCEHADCGEPRNCQQRIREYMRMQWKIQNRREKR